MPRNEHVFIRHLCLHLRHIEFSPSESTGYYLLIEPFLSFFIPLTSNPLSVSWAEEGSGVDRLGLTLNLLLERDGVGRDEWRGCSRSSL